MMAVTWMAVTSMAVTSMTMTSMTMTSRSDRCIGAALHRFHDATQEQGNVLFHNP
jgi:hypothetical protein